MLIINNLKWKLANFLQRRNGNDDLSRITFLVSVILYLVSIVLDILSLESIGSILYVIGFAGIIYSLFRIFSGNVPARQRENDKYLHFISLQKKRFAMRKEYRIFACKGCGQHIRVPKKKGKVEVTCPVCGRKAIHRT
ncbi:MAG: hypothetical protein KH268_08460 [Clostridiales bacterium]|nr:hypothetical protein [Clostridiales bacterium]